MCIRDSSYFSWEGKSAVAHRVNPVEGEEWVLVIDWVAVQE